MESSARSRKLLFDVAQDHGVAAAGEDVGDAAAHGAAAEDGDGADIVQCHCATDRKASGPPTNVVGKT